MSLPRLLFFVFAFSLIFCFQYKAFGEKVLTPKIVKIEMHLSAFGVESDSFPSISVYIDFVKDSNICEKSYYDPKIKSSVYKLSNGDVAKFFKLLNETDWNTFKTEYSVSLSDQPTSTIKIYTTNNSFSIKDYGLKADYPLTELYKIVYKLK